MKELKNNLYILALIWKIKKSYLIISLVLGILGSLGPVLMNLMIKFALDSLIVIENFNRFLRLLILYSSYSLILALVNTWYSNIFQKILGEEINENIWGRLYEKSRQIPLKSYDDSEFFNRYNFVLSNSISTIYNTVNLFTNLMSALFGISFLITIIITIDPVMLIFSLITSIINFGINLKISKLSYELEKDSNPHHRKKNYVGRVYYLKDYAVDLRTTNIWKALEKLYKEGIEGAIETIKSRGKTISTYSSIQSFVQVGNTFIVMLYLSKSLANRYISVGDFAAVFNSYGQLSSYIERILGFFPQMYRNSLYIEDFRNFIETEHKTQSGVKSLEEIEEIRCSDISFSYHDGVNILENINISISSGEKIALVGRNGAGKSTLAKILQGLYEVDKGKVSINGLEISQYSQETINRRIGSLSQDFKVYSLSILENIYMDSLLDIGNSEEKASSILSSLNLSNKINKLDKGIRTNISYELGDGTSFSGGEEQKLALARVLVKDYDLIILDEPSSALDIYSEKEIFDNILKKYSEKIIVLISHKLANVVNVDKIYVLDNGKIIEEGNHEELMEKDGLYKELFELQAKNYI